MHTTLIGNSCGTRREKERDVEAERERKRGRGGGREKKLWKRRLNVTCGEHLCSDRCWLGAGYIEPGETSPNLKGISV